MTNVLSTPGHPSAHRGPPSDAKNTPANAVYWKEHWCNKPFKISTAKLEQPCSLKPQVSPGWGMLA